MIGQTISHHKITLDANSMKTLCATILIIGFIQLSPETQGQSTTSKLDQVSLMKQFVGQWKGEMAKDTVEVMDIQAFGKGFVVSYKYFAKGTTYHEGRQLWGFDPNYETFVCYSLSRQGQFKIYTGQFTSPNRIFWEGKSTANPDTVLSRYDWEFKSSNVVTIATTTEGGIPKVYVYNKIHE